MLEASHLPLLAEPWIGACGSPQVLFTTNTLPARILEVEYPNTVSNLPVSLDASSYLDDLACWFMGWNHGQVCRKLALQDLEV